jgi:hypothetical protein
MNEFQLVEHYGEVSRVLRHLRPLSADQVAEKIVQLYRRHSSEITKVMDEAMSAHASNIREGRLPATCAIILAVSESYRGGRDHPEKEDNLGPAPPEAKPRGKPRRRAVDEDIEAVRARVRQMRKENMSAFEMCKSLGDDPRPQGAAWANLPWPEAWKSVHRDSVKVWLSKNSKAKV